MTTQSTAPLQARYHGITEECTTCQHCGRSDLKKTIMLFILDADGNAEELTYYGTSCAARALGTTNARVARQAAAAEVARQGRIRTLSACLSDMDPMGRFPAETRRAWTTVARWGRTVVVDGVEYGPECGEGRMFLGFAEAQTAAWRRELAACGG